MGQNTIPSAPSWTLCRSLLRLLLKQKVYFAILINYISVRESLSSRQYWLWTILLDRIYYNILPLCSIVRRYDTSHHYIWGLGVQSLDIKNLKFGKSYLSKWTLIKIILPCGRQSAADCSQNLFSHIGTLNALFP